MTPSDCPRFMKCSANICPIDEKWRQRSHVTGDPVCIVMRETGKAGADARFEDYPVLKEIRLSADALIAELITIKEKYAGDGMPRGLGEVLRGIEASKLTGSSLDQNKASGERLKAAIAAQAEL